MDLFTQTIKYVDASFSGKQKPHFERTVFWYLYFKDDATEAEQIAAYSHDIERAFRSPETLVPKDYLDPEFLKYHQEEGARIMCKWLNQCSAPTHYDEIVSHLISKHEVGGDEDQNHLMNADSISFFETNAQMFVEKKAPIEGIASVRPKLDWMFNRVTSEEAKKIARPNYEKWVNLLEHL